MEDFNFSNYYDQIVEHEIATEAEVNLVTDINGNTIEALDDILYVRTGNRDWEQYCDEHEIDNVFEEDPLDADDVEADYRDWVCNKLTEWSQDYESTYDDKVDFDTCMENAPDWFDNHIEEFCDAYGYDYDGAIEAFDDWATVVEEEVLDKIEYMYNHREWDEYSDDDEDDNE